MYGIGSGMSKNPPLPLKQGEAGRNMGVILNQEEKLPIGPTHRFPQLSNFFLETGNRQITMV